MQVTRSPKYTVVVEKVTSYPIDQKLTRSTSYNIDQLSANRVGFNLLLHWVLEMAAPIPPPRGGAGRVGGGAVPPPPPIPGPVGPAGLVGPTGPPGPLGPPPARATLLAQMVAAMQAAAAGIPAPGGPMPPLPREKLPPPIFKGLPGKRPEAHLLRANDWMDTYNILPVTSLPTLSILLII